MSALCSAFSRLQLGSRLAIRATPLVSRQALVPPVRRASVLVEALGNKDSVKRREEQNKKNMLYNRRYKDEIKYYSKKALKGMNLMMKEPDQVQSEADLAEIQGWINSAFSIIDKAVLKGVLHKNTGARRKARLSANRRRLLIAAGLYTPASA